MKRRIGPPNPRPKPIARPKPMVEKKGYNPPPVEPVVMPRPTPAPPPKDGMGIRKTIEKLELHEGDILVATVPDETSTEDMMELKKVLIMVTTDAGWKDKKIGLLIKNNLVTLEVIKPLKKG